MARYLYSELAMAIEARRNCEASGNMEWFKKHTDRILQLQMLLPGGSGIDHGTSHCPVVLYDCRYSTKVDLDASHGEKLVLHAGFHHMSESGMYDGWTEHTITVTPSFRGINLRISGRNRNGIKEYLYDTYEYALRENVEDRPLATDACADVIPANACPKCGENFATHDGDGSCVQD